jgi:hypothetical protein
MVTIEMTEDNYILKVSSHGKDVDYKIVYVKEDE